MFLSLNLLNGIPWWCWWSSFVQDLFFLHIFFSAIIVKFSYLVSVKIVHWLEKDSEKQVMCDSTRKKIKKRQEEEWRFRLWILFRVSISHIFIKTHAKMQRVQWTHFSKQQKRNTPMQIVMSWVQRPVCTCSAVLQTCAWWSKLFENTVAIVTCTRKTFRLIHFDTKSFVKKKTLT